MRQRVILITAMLLFDACSNHQGGNELASHDNLAPRKSMREVGHTLTPTVDPKSQEAAEELVWGFARLLNEGRLGEAYMLLGPGAAPRNKFDGEFLTMRDRKVTVQAAGEQQGAAGSTYVSVPFILSGTANGNRVRRSAMAVLRRVNDVPGSTEAQRHWHIERIDWRS